MFGEALQELSKFLPSETTSTLGQIWYWHLIDDDSCSGINFFQPKETAFIIITIIIIIINMYNLPIIIQVPELQEPALGAHKPKSCLAYASTRILGWWWGNDDDYDQSYFVNGDDYDATFDDDTFDDDYDDDGDGQWMDLLDNPLHPPPPPPLWWYATNTLMICYKGFGWDREEELQSKQHWRILWRLQRTQHGHDGRRYKGSSSSLSP